MGVGTFAVHHTADFLTYSLILWGRWTKQIKLYNKLMMVMMMTMMMMMLADHTDRQLYKSSASAEVADRNVTWYVL